MKRKVGFKASTEENLVKEEKVIFYYKNTRISHGPYDI